jgi:hypothetical protein
MAGYVTLDEYSGETVQRMYTHPFVVRGVPRMRGVYDRPEHETITAFKTLAEAQAWLAKWEPAYRKGANGFASLHVENWNE